MLSKIYLKNFLSFKQETIIDVRATNYKMLSDTNVKDDVLKGLLFVGSNASGKTNAITSIHFLLKSLFSNENIDYNYYFCLFSNTDDMSLEYTFNVESNEIIYGFSFDVDGVTKEYLIYNKEKLFDRLGTNAHSLITDKTNYFDSDIDRKTLFLRNIYFNTKFTKYPILKKWFGSLNNSVYLNAVKRITNVFNSNNELLIRNYLEKNGVKKINDFFNYFGFDQQICYENEHHISKDSYAVVKEKEIFIKRENIDIWFPLVRESLGNQTLLNMLPAIIHSLENESIIIIDEFSSALHNELEELIVRFFMKNSNNSQIFFVSHSTNLLSTTLLRPDQIYSSTFEDENGTKLKRFSSEGPRESQNLERMYLNGVFDGIPRYKNKN